jgi:rRNA maturation protein Nop10
VTHVTSVIELRENCPRCGSDGVVHVVAEDGAANHCYACGYERKVSHPTAHDSAPERVHIIGRRATSAVPQLALPVP